jgi:hypothetical protein
MSKKDKLASISIIGTIRFARSMPVSISTRCIAEPIGSGAAHDPKGQAALDMLCYLPTHLFDAERGHYVCREHGDALGNSHAQQMKIERASPFTRRSRHLSETKRALNAIAWIKRRLRALYRAELSSGRVTVPELVDVTFLALTYQVRVSTDHALGRRDN